MVQLLSQALTQLKFSELAISYQISEFFIIRSQNLLIEPRILFLFM